MWSVLIADDEPKIRKRLKRIVESIGPDFRVCGEAEDGLEALARIDEELPDILLVDICMPKLNGLDFIEKIESSVSNSIIIVVSGHDEFDYAKRAVQLPIFEYVLKPVEVSSLERIMLRATDVLNDRRRKNELIQWAEQEVRNSRDEMVQDLLFDWISGYSMEGEVSERKKVLLSDFPADVRLLAIQINAFCYGISALEIEEYKVLSLAVKRLTTEFIGSDVSFLAFNDERDHLLFLIDGRFLPEDGERLAREIRDRLNLPVRCGVADATMDYDGFAAAYENLCRSVDGSGRDSSLIRKIYAFIEHNYRDKGLDLSIAESALSLSPGYISRLLKQNTGYSFSEFLNRYRILEAIRRLKEEDSLIYEIAEEVGYSSQHYFSRIFHRIAGVSPAEYRRSRGNG
jgi:two-component system response regulator YesN